MRRIVDELVATPTPARTIASYMANVNRPNVTAFERYIGMTLRDAGGEKICCFPPNKAIHLIPPGEGHLVRLVCAARLEDSEAQTLHDVESALNRLFCIVDVLEDSADFNLYGFVPDERTVTISFMGGGFLPERPGYRSAHVLLPEIDSTEQLGMAYLNEVDWRTLDHVAAIARPVFQSSMLPNMYRSFMGAHGPNDSDWDVRTRLAAILGELELSLHIGYHFDCDTSAGSAAVRFILPSIGSFPKRVSNSSLRLLEEVGERAHDALMSYAMRLSCLLAAACFGAGRHIETAFVSGVRDDGKSTALACAFDRSRFVKHVMTAIDSGSLSDPSLRFDPAGTAAMMAPDFIDYTNLADEKSQVPSFDDGMARQRIPVHADDRELPDEMKKLFHALRISDIATGQAQRDDRSVVEQARTDSEDSLIAAIAHLESAIDELEPASDAPDDDAGARPLYCSNPLSRAMVSLLDDELTVGVQAEAFLRERSQLSGPADREPNRLPRFFRTPSELFDAHMGLSDLYARLGDMQGAQSHAYRCLQLAPTCAQAYYRMADVLAQLERYPEAVNVLFAGLRTAVAERDCALLYYHLGLLLWVMGRKNEAAAVHVYTTSFSGEHAEKARMAIENLRKRHDSSVIVHASTLAAAREMSRAHIPVAPSDEARVLVVQAAVGLSCAHAPVAAAPYAAALARYFKDDPVITATADSIISGTEGRFPLRLV